VAYVGFEVLTAVVLNFAIFWDTASCSLCMSRRFGGTYHSSHLIARLFLCRLIFDPEDGSDTFFRNGAQKIAAFNNGLI
jgi:hypothetical protein